MSLKSISLKLNIITFKTRQPQNKSTIRNLQFRERLFGGMDVSLISRNQSMFFPCVIHLFALFKLAGLNVPSSHVAVSGFRRILLCSLFKRPCLHYFENKR